MSLEKCGCGSTNVKIKKVKVSAAHVECGSCGTLGPTVQEETDDEADVSATEAWNVVRKRNSESDK